MPIFVGDKLISGSVSSVKFDFDAYIELDGYDYSYNVNTKTETIFKDGEVFATRQVTKEVFEDDFIIKNLVQNGSFENGISGWKESTGAHIYESQVSSNAVVGRKVLYFKNNAANAYIWQEFPNIPSGHQLYARVTGWIGATVDNAVFFSVQDGNNNTAATGTRFLHSDMSTSPQTKSFIKTLTVDGSRILLSGWITGSQEAWYDGLILIDLTETYGAGNEPTKEWMDANIPNFDSSYTWQGIKQYTTRISCPSLGIDTTKVMKNDHWGNWTTIIN